MFQCNTINHTYLYTLLKRLVLIFIFQKISQQTSKETDENTRCYDVRCCSNDFNNPGALRHHIQNKHISIEHEVDKNSWLKTIENYFNLYFRLNTRSIAWDDFTACGKAK